ncbi:hypothetical protein PAXRUDRAFT_460328 [Paxillus rubicundulus Ve08.2h10]|uniref:Uncharacterized protein n=1 Tax=Paxillus rubicundulus Ve08.2h10 TaxID=930991 RepID=A0A0D0DWI5_9AGAM|nr:hypothetical protein PAXRUDRAFT_460328 [Paxillus rubicundulus Ve08.2h10]
MLRFLRGFQRKLKAFGPFVHRICYESLPVLVYVRRLNCTGRCPSPYSNSPCSVTIGLRLPEPCAPDISMKYFPQPKSHDTNVRAVSSSKIMKVVISE